MPKKSENDKILGDLTRQAHKLYGESRKPQSQRVHEAKKATFNQIRGASAKKNLTEGERKKLRAKSAETYSKAARAAAKEDQKTGTPRQQDKLGKSQDRAINNASRKNKSALRRVSRKRRLSLKKRGVKMDSPKQERAKKK